MAAALFRHWRRRVGFRSAKILLAAGIVLLGPCLAAAETSFVTFESGLVRPLALSPDGTRLFACNTPDGTLEIFDVEGGVTHVGSVAVGLEPVAVAARTNNEVWVVNHLSDSVSVIDVSGVPHVIRTLLVGDEPQDVVFAGAGGTRAFVTTAHRGQASPYPAGEYDVPGIGRADVWVFDATNLGTSLGGTPITVVTLFGDKPRALAVSPDGGTVYAAVFRSGNRTTTIHDALVCDTSAANAATETVQGPCVVSGTAVPGGYPPPLANVEGVPMVETGLIVKQDRDGGSSGAWLDELGRDWSAAVRFNLPDLDVFAIDADADPPVETAAFANVGTLLFNMATNPISGKLYVSNTEARNEVRLEGLGVLAAGLKPVDEPPSVRGRLAETRITVIDPTGTVSPRHLNRHIPYGTFPQAPDVEDKSLAIPLQIAVSPDGTTLYVAAFGSSKIGVFEVAALEADTFVPDESRHITLAGGGPSGLVLDGNRLFTLTRFDQSLVVMDLTQGAVGAEVLRLPLHNPEPWHVVTGRPFLYDARLTGSNGEASCASCHPFGDMDDLAWDLGDPDDVVAPNANPIRAGAPSAFHPIKGPMTTQSLRGLVHAGPQHWRGDRQGDAVQAFNAFNVAFPKLIGRDEGELPAADMQKLTDFAMTIAYPPNPVRRLDGSLRPIEESGRAFFDGPTSDTTGSCNICHVVSPVQGFFGTDGFSADQITPREFKTPHLRNLYQKVGMFGMARIPRVPVDGDYGHQGPQVRGFGFFHDGSFDTAFRFLELNVFDTAPSAERDLEAFMMAFASDLAPMVGQQITRTATNGSTVDGRIDAILAAGATPYPSRMLGLGARACEVIVKGTLGSVAIGGVVLSDGSVRMDDDGILDEAALRAVADVTGQELTYTCVPFGSGTRMGIDRDVDERLNRLDNCPDRWNPDQADDDEDGVGDACEPGAMPIPTATPTPSATPTPTTTPTPTGPAQRPFGTRSLTMGRLLRPAGEQSLRLVSDDLDGIGATFDVRSELVTLTFSVADAPFVTVTIAGGDPRWKVRSGGRRFEWGAGKASHPSGLQSLGIGAPGGPFRVKASFRNTDGAGAVGVASVEVALRIGNDLWGGPTPPCTPSGSGQSLRCR